MVIYRKFIYEEWVYGCVGCRYVMYEKAMYEKVTYRWFIYENVSG